MGFPDRYIREINTPEKARARLKELIIENALQIAPPEKMFTLSSGKEAAFYFDMRRLYSGEGLTLATNLMLDHVSTYEVPPTRIVVSGRAGDLWAASFAMLGYQKGLPLREATVVL